MENRAKALKDKAIKLFGFEDRKTITIFSLLDRAAEENCVEELIVILENWFEKEKNKPFEE